ncbi:putative peripheral membrane protein [Suillus clintonianus]|uniref:putative peripheral membrane protein n=1 Tax=Suillus clintonianus TaxID=1904413 RepID=UPI001B874F62|nr:putative peripheral membrane protein [Suillus clintonianus]KAG2142447.1 putative peripheral membrane protein [Suillus clintonianus]
MIHICRAEDGESYQVNANLRDIERRGSLEAFLHEETGVDQDAILAYLSDGTRLRTDNVRELVGAHDQTIYVFNKYYLDFDLNDVLHELRVNPPLQPPIEESIATTPPYRPSQLASSYLRTAHIHLEYIVHTVATLHRQHQAARIASSSLELNVLAIADVFDGIAVTARKDLERQAALLAGLDADLEIISRVRIHVEFMSPAVRNAIENGERPRTLGDYVSNVRMKQVADACARTHEDLRAQFQDAEKSAARLTNGTDSVRATVMNTQILDGAEASSRRAQEIIEKASDVAAALESPATDPNNLLRELKHLDGALRNEVQDVTEAKNAYTEQCIGVLRQISALNIDIVQLPTTLSNLQGKFRAKNSFSHIQRLHNMLYAYGATVVEIVRRKEFAHFFYQRAQSILEVMAKLSASERKRRQVYRGEVHGQLPFDTKGIDDVVPTIDFSPSGSKEPTYSLNREDIDVLLQVLSDLESWARSSSDPVAMGSVQEARTAVDKVIAKMDNLEAGFDRIAERSLLSASRLSSSRRRLTEADEHAFQELAEQLRETQEAQVNQEKLIQQERTSFQAEIHRLHSDLQTTEVTSHSERERADIMERELHQAKAQIESEAAARRILERRNLELAQDLEKERQNRVLALADATEQTRAVEVLRQELSQVHSQAEEVKALEARNASKVAQLVEEQATTLRNLEAARARGENLETQIQTARSECEEVNRALKNTNMEKDRLLRLQANEHDRIMRDHIAEADGDRAVLEHQFSELRAQLEDTERQLKEARSQTELTNADAMGLREELQRVEHELREARHIERILRDDLTAGRASQSDYEHRLENSGRLVAQMLDVAIAFRNSHCKALSLVHNLTSHPSSSKQVQSLAESTLTYTQRHGAQADEPSPIDPSDLLGALESLRAFDHDHFLEAVTRTGSIIRKWQKQCKEYRERAKGKISFRNFAKGDLALFLPTRNSISKPWAAFNVSFPHYFLLATGHLAEQLKTREWIVARITSITERVVDSKDPSSNPYGLGDGVKYYMLEVEDWTQAGQVNKRRPAVRKVSALSDPETDRKTSSDPPESPPSQSPAPPQSEFESVFSATQPPTSSSFPIRARANSTPIAGPSSLSRLLAQAPPESTLEIIAPSRDASPPTTPPPPPPPPSPPAQQVDLNVQQPASLTHAPYVPSPLRPGSRASRGSSSSRFSAVRLPPLASVSASPAAVKAVATTALTEHNLSSISPPHEFSADGGPPSPQGSVSEGMTSIFLNRRRTTSHHVPRSSPLASSNFSGAPSASATSTLASLASNFVSFGRSKKVDMPAPIIEAGHRDQAGGSEVSARDMLRRF